MQLQCYGGPELLYGPRPPTRSQLASEGRRLHAGFKMPRLWRPPADGQETASTAIAVARSSAGESKLEAGQEPPVQAAPPAVPLAVPPPDVPVLSPREVAVQDVISKLQEERLRINATAEACGVASHKAGGIAPLPEGDVQAGKIIDLTEGPHGDTKTKCRMATLPSLMKVCFLLMQKCWILQCLDDLMHVPAALDRAYRCTFPC